jgi:hypothetical protein
MVLAQPLSMARANQFQRIYSWAGSDPQGGSPVGFPPNFL